MAPSSFPTDIKLKYVPVSAEHSSLTSCGVPQTLDLAAELPGKKVVITGAPGAFTPTCTEQHIPQYLAHVKDFKAKGVDRIIVVTANDPFVNAAWGKALGNTDASNYVVFATDPAAELSSQLGDNFALDLSKQGMGLRLARYAAIVVDGEIQYLESENGGGFTEVSSTETLLERL